MLVEGDSPIRELSRWQDVNIYYLIGWHALLLGSAAYLIAAGHKAAIGMRFLTGAFAACIPFLEFPHGNIHMFASCGAGYYSIHAFFGLMLVVAAVGGGFLILCPEHTLLVNSGALGWLLGTSCWAFLSRLIFSVYFMTQNRSTDAQVIEAQQRRNDLTLARNTFLLSLPDLGVLVFGLLFAGLFSYRAVMTRYVVYPFLLAFLYAFVFTNALLELAVVVSYFLGPYHGASAAGAGGLSDEEIARGFADLNTRTMMNLGFGWRTIFFWPMPSFLGKLRTLAMTVAAHQGALAHGSDERRVVLTEYASFDNKRIVDLLCPFFFGVVMVYFCMCASLIRLADTIPRDPEDELEDGTGASAPLSGVSKRGSRRTRA